MRTDRTWHPSPLELDLLLLEGEDGDDGEARARIERHLERCRACAAVHQAGQAAAARFRAEVLPRRSRELHALCGVTRTRRPLRLTLFGLIPALAGGLAAAAGRASGPLSPAGDGPLRPNS